MPIRGHKKFSSSVQIFIYNPESKEDIHLAHIELPITSPQPLTDPRAAIVFQPTARASPARTKTNRWSAHRLEALEIWFFFSMCAKWMSSLESDFMLNIWTHVKFFLGYLASSVKIHFPISDFDT